MACECLDEGRRIRCTAVDGEVIPSLHEREHYCWSDPNHASCPTFQAFRRAQRQLAQQEYYALWTQPKLPPINPQKLQRPQASPVRLEDRPANLRVV